MSGLSHRADDEYGNVYGICRGVCYVGQKHQFISIAKITRTLFHSISNIVLTLGSN
jgi:hypothetical protein